MNKIEFGKNLKTLLSSKNMTYKDLANRCGKAESWVSQIIRRNQIPKSEDLEIMIRVFGRDKLQKLFLGIDESSPKLPLLSWVQAGSWSEIISTGDVEYIEVPYSNVKDSMSRSPGKSYYDGIFVIVDPNCDKSKDALNRKIVIARMNGESTIKEFVLEGDKPYLSPWNPKYSILEVTSSVEIVGIVIHSFD